MWRHGERRTSGIKVRRSLFSSVSPMSVRVAKEVRQVDVTGVRVVSQSSGIEQIHACGHEGEKQGSGECVGGVAAPAAKTDDAFTKTAEGEKDGEESEWIEFHGVPLLVARCDDFIIRGGVVKRQHLGVSWCRDRGQGDSRPRNSCTNQTKHLVKSTLAQQR